MASPIQKWEDAFGKQVSLGTTNEADIAGHYEYNPERWRVFVNGTRQQIEYGSISEYNHNTDVHELTPQNSGDVVRMATNERFRYVVQYVIEWSGALQTNQALQDGDAVVFGYGDADLENSDDDFPGPSADGWFFHWHSGLDDQQVRIAEYRDGSVTVAKELDIENAITDWGRYAGETNWYNVGETEYTETYTEDVGNDQRNPSIGKTSAPKEKGPKNANKPIALSVKAVGGVGSLQADLGSVGLRTLGDVTGIVRQKTAKIDSSVGTADTWVPVAAIRVDPNRNIVNTQIDVLQPVDWDTDVDINVLGISVDPSNTDASGWETPVEHNSSNSVIEQTTTITEFPDGTGATVTSTDNPGGYQVAFGSRYTSGQGSGSKERNTTRTAKRQLSDRDVLVVLANSSATLTDLKIEYRTEQDF